ncbi:MAG TPA: DnaJ family domain-containing protein, partial [Gammaproteobacteria bacterium]|nr:DnaJ family domain-containing protein [Gammaproteobacteria bacterium]
MFLIDQIVEARIAEAMERGEFDNLSGVGKPLQLDDDSHIPQ